MTTDKEMPNRVADLYKDRTIFITGGTGFLGKVLIETLLRTTEVKTIYLLLRAKKGKNPHERLPDIFNNMLFDVLKKKDPNALKKIKAIAGDVSEVDLGISVEDRKVLQNEVEFIFHCAASTRFDDTIRVAAKMNIRGTKYVLDLSAQCKQLMCIIHVSTAYAYPKEKVLYEKIYKPPADPQEVMDAINWENDAENNSLAIKFLGDCPNTYTFSKACAEALVVQQFNKIPAIIVRPSIICPTLSKPIPGWCNNLQGPMGLLVGAGKGIIRSMYVNSASHADFVPADYAVNGLLLIVWYNLTQNKEARIFNATASSEYNFTWEEIIEEGKYIVRDVLPFNGVAWYPGGSMKKSRLHHNICFYLLQLLPAIFIDALLIVLGYKPILYNIQRRIQNGGEMFEYYTTRAWNFCNASKEKILEAANEVEKEVFRIEPENFNIRQYFTDCVHTVRRNNLKESDETIPAARTHMKVMYYVDNVVKIGFVAIVFYYLYQLLQLSRLRF